MAGPLRGRRSSGGGNTPGPGDWPFRTEGVTTTALAPHARADANAGLATVDDVCLATRHAGVWRRVSTLPQADPIALHLAPDLRPALAEIVGDGRPWTALP
jgi:hypothetical protein